MNDWCCRGYSLLRRTKHAGGYGGGHRRLAGPGPPPADGSSRGHYAVELPAGDSRVQTCAGSGRWLTGCAQALPVHAAVEPAIRETGQGRSAAGGCSASSAAGFPSTTAPIAKHNVMPPYNNRAAIWRLKSYA